MQYDETNIKKATGRGEDLRLDFLDSIMNAGPVSGISANTERAYKTAAVKLMMKPSNLGALWYFILVGCQGHCWLS